MILFGCGIKLHTKGGMQVANIDKLKDAIKESGMTITSIAKKTGIIRATLYNRLNSDGDFKVSEIESLTKVLHLSTQKRDEIFFDSNV